ncbi:MAG TPA: hypothetical protein VFF28_04195 [Candidatus Nanoarchaeia archaeon]|nr:hypothetical protein [Candidatus Nanoarchaeia archaeon]
MEDNREKILQYIRMKGPVLPADIGKQINSNILFASAHLSELSSNGKVKVSSIKVGGSPLYYLPGQESMLQRFADDLGEKDKRAYNLLHEKKVLRDIELEPLMRVALRGIKDFAIPLQVNLEGNSEIFWRWQEVTNQQAEELIRPLFVKEEKKIAEEKQEVEKEEIKKVPEPEVKHQEKNQETNLEQKQEPRQELKPAPRQEIKKEIQSQISKDKPRPKKEITDDGPFLDKISDHFKVNKIKIISKEQIRKSEFDLIIDVPSAVGNLEYYCKAKGKQKITDGDLASAFVQGQVKKLPVLLITNGELTKRAAEMLQKEFKGMSIAQI